jgi:hypothetical protein
MVFPKKVLILSFVATLMASPISAAVDSTFHIYLLFGQSNMAGGGAGVTLGGSGSGTLIAADCDTSPRVKVLAFCDCASGVTGAACTYTTLRTENTWYTAHPALHICNEGVSPGDWFAKTMLDSIRADIKIGLIPCALSGQSLNVFFPGGNNFAIPNWAHPTLNNSSPYAWMLAKCKLAQQTGVIKGILLHQGESGQGSPPALTWPAMCTAIMDSLKKNLNLPSTLPVVVGELRQGGNSCCAGFNTNIDQFASQYPNCGLAASAGAAIQTDDPYHFNAAGMRTMGYRYAVALLAHASASYIPRKGTSNTINDRVVMYQAMKSATSNIRVYSLNGRALKSYAATNSGNALRNLNATGVYIVSRKLNDGRTAILPFIKE